MNKRTTRALFWVVFWAVMLLALLIRQRGS
ncbi:hypothetical protein CYFUS_002638 [Cystobacter fuscus]|uniref:Uncharacterized protein n=1 Tax=Cystobacter fuscus TaxID=43 RepID=A0A250J197_9BACT|nr:hypothetical protein CYFUS_002638 [Cystobacter fuscus]